MKHRALLFAICLTFAAVNTASAALIFDFAEVGGDVVLAVSGSIDLSATDGFFGSGVTSTQAISPSSGAILAGDPVVFDIYDVSVASWAPFGTGGLTSFSSSSGDRVALGGDPALGLPAGYVSGSPLSATGTILAATFASLGLTPGSYVTSLNNQQFSDTVTVNVGAQAAPVPEPATLLLVGAGLAGAVARRRRSR